MQTSALEYSVFLDRHQLTHHYKICCEYLYQAYMTSETKPEGNVPNPFLNPTRFWENYLIYWIEASRNFYGNAIKTSNGSKYSGTRGSEQETHHKEKQ
jgi:hypothetical protein